MKRRKCTRRIGQNWIPNSGVCERSNNQRDTVTQSIVIVSPRYRYQSSSSYLSRLGKTKGRESKKKGPDPVTISNFLSATTVTISHHMLRPLPFLSFTDIDYCLYRYLPNSSPIFLFFSIDLPSRHIRSFMDRIKERALAENNCHVIRSDRFTFGKNPRLRIIDNLFSFLDEITASG